MILTQQRIEAVHIVVPQLWNSLLRETCHTDTHRLLPTHTHTPHAPLFIFKMCSKDHPASEGTWLFLIAILTWLLPVGVILVVVNAKQWETTRNSPKNELQFLRMKLNNPPGVPLSTALQPWVRFEWVTEASEGHKDPARHLIGAGPVSITGHVHSSIPLPGADLLVPLSKCKKGRCQIVCDGRFLLPVCTERTLGWPSETAYWCMPWISPPPPPPPQ